MSDSLKNKLAITGMVALLVFAYAAASYANSYSKSFEPSSFRSFGVSGEGKIVAVPDVAAFTFSVLTKGGKDISDLQKKNADKVNEAIKFVKAQGVSDKDIKTEQYNLQPEYQYFNCNPGIYSAEPVPCPPAEIVGYTITQTVSVKVRDFKKAGEVLGGVVSNGANSVSQLNFTIDDPSKLENEAREEAIRNAKEKAVAVAKAGGFRLGRLLGIEEAGGSYPMPYAMANDGYSGKAMLESAASRPAIEAGSQDVKVVVNLRYEIE